MFMAFEGGDEEAAEFDAGARESGFHGLGREVEASRERANVEAGEIFLLEQRAVVGVELDERVVERVSERDIGGVVGWRFRRGRGIA